MSSWCAQLCLSWSWFVKEIWAFLLIWLFCLHGELCRLFWQKTASELRVIATTALPVTPCVCAEEQLKLSLSSPGNIRPEWSSSIFHPPAFPCRVTGSRCLSQAGHTPDRSASPPHLSSWNWNPSEFSFCESGSALNVRQLSYERKRWLVGYKREWTVCKLRSLRHNVP